MILVFDILVMDKDRSGDKSNEREQKQRKERDGGSKIRRKKASRQAIRTDFSGYEFLLILAIVQSNQLNFTPNPI